MKHTDTKDAGNFSTVRQRLRRRVSRLRPASGDVGLLIFPVAKSIKIRLYRSELKVLFAKRVNTIRPTALKNEAPQLERNPARPGLRGWVRDRFFPFLILCLLFAVASQAEGGIFFFRRHHHPAQVTAQAVYAVDYTNRQVLFSRNPHGRFYPASTVKLLTALVVLDHKDLKDKVVVSGRATCVQPTKAGLTCGATYTVEDLLEVLLATSANDAAVALAEAVAGTQEKFAWMMNEKAKALGAKDSYFTNPTGLPDRRQLTSAYDLTLISRAAFSKPFIASVMKRKVVVIAGSDGKRIVRQNHNKMLWRVPYPLVLGKTGYTIAAKHCYAGIAYYDDKRVSIVFMKSRKPWLDIYSILGISKKHR